MFSDFTQQIRAGEFPASEPLGRRLEIALIKKLGVMNQPYLCRSGDPKINPPTKQLLWCALFLRDAGKIQTIEGILATEISEKKKLQIAELTDAVKQYVRDSIDEFLALPASLLARERLEKIIQQAPPGEDD